MESGKLVSTCVLLLASGGAWADGTLTRKGAKTPMTAVYAGLTITEMGSGVVVFTDKAQLAERVSMTPGKEPDNVAREISDKGGQVVVLKILRDLSPMLWVCKDHCQQSVVFDEKSLRLALARYDDERVEGTIKGAGDGMDADLSFSLDVHNVAEAAEYQGPNGAHDSLAKHTLLPEPIPPGTPSVFYSDGAAFGLADSYAFTAQDEFNHDARNRGRPVLVFSDKPLDKAALANADSVLQALKAQSDAGRIRHYVVLRLLADRKVFVDLRGDDPTYAAMGDDSQLLTIKRDDGRRIEGAYTCKDPNEKRLLDHLCFDLQFALDVVRAK